ncbi:glycosyltransferase family 2 protein [Dysgonomonas sp. 25]|uniref:glycosyltransferase family 2 protein n=1 Tax=Dysgonomonas sp. 25 TaxID=2302933 RepID=UPI0013D13168|nr:glycosyltransferase family 2 protein [Dysgonomonas sp. 25]NDV69015.1 glycosyltransferase [Dysgonomonas sp. 25]
MYNISIIVATYNAEKYIERCLLSIISNKSEIVELVIIDGGSTDETTKIIGKYKPHIDYFISEKDNGIYDAWNKALKVVKGKWIQFIGADDIMFSDALNKMLAFADTAEVDEIDLILGKEELVDASGKLLKYYGAPFSWSIFRNYMNIAHGASFHNRKLFDEVGFFDTSYKSSADYELLLRKRNTLNCIFMDEIIIKMQIGGTSFSIKGLIETFKVKQQHKSNNLLMNSYYLIKGILGLAFKRLIWKI